MLGYNLTSTESFKFNRTEIENDTVYLYDNMLLVGVMDVQDFLFLTDKDNQEEIV